MLTEDRMIQEKILMQLEERGLPFRKYRFSNLGKGLEHLGSGGFAEVFAAESRKADNREYAIKVIGFGDKSVSPESFYETVSQQLLLESGSFNIVKVFAFVQIYITLDKKDQITEVEIIHTPNSIEKKDAILLQFMVMERLIPLLHPDGSRKWKLSSGTEVEPQKEDVLKVAFDLAKALEQLHNKGVLHRDVKLENVFYSEKERKFKLGDFGIAKKTLYGVANERIYTKGYGAPEIVGTLGEVYDARADMYSFGVLLYVLMNRMCLPGSDSYKVNIDEQYMSGFVFPEPANKMDGLWEIVKKCCSYYPGNRYDSMTEVVREIEALLFSDLVEVKDSDRSFYRLLGWVSVLAGGWLLFLSKQSGEALPWQAVTLIVYGLIIGIERSVFFYRDEEALELNYRKFNLWGLMTVFSFVVAICVAVTKYISVPLYEAARPQNDWIQAVWLQKLLSVEVIKAGILLGCLSIFSCARDWFLMRVKRKRKKRIG